MSFRNIFLSTVVVSCLFCAVSAQAQEAEATPKKSELRANFRRMGLELSSTEVSNAKEYKDSPETDLNTDSQTLIKGVLDFALEYDTDISRWDNSVFLGYGKTKIKSEDNAAETNENEDKILLTTDYTHKIWKIKSLDLGPFASLAYQTEFTRNDDAPRMRVFREKTGLKLLSGKVIKELYVAGVGEYDITYKDEHVSKLAAETGWRLEKDLREGVTMATDGYFRKYLTYSQYVGTDLKYDFNITGRMDVKVTDTLVFGPYVSYRMAQSREASKKGSNFMIGVSLAYKDLFNLFQ